MKALAKLGGRIDDLLNPIVVKELRQAVRSRFVSGLLILLLILQLAVVAVYVMSIPSDAESFSEGRAINSILYGILVFSCILFVPVYAGVRLAWERSETQMDLMYTTTISPGAIVRGKLFGAAAITVLIYSACMPFMTFTYLLRGVDLPTVFFLLAIGFVQTLAAAQLAIFVACIPTSRVFKVLLGLVTLNGLWVWAGISVAWMPLMSLRGSMVYGGWEWWSVALTFIGLAALGIGLLYVLSVAMISPASADRMRPVRLYLAALLPITGALAAVWAWSTSEWAPWEVWTYVWAFGLAFFFPIVMSERESWGPRIRAAIPRSPPARIVSFLFTTGAAGGFFWNLLMVLCTWAACVAVTAAFRNYGLVPGVPAADGPTIVIGIALYGIAYTLTAMLFRRILGLAKLNIPVNYTWLIAFLMITLGSVGPYVLCFFLYFNEGPAVVLQERAWIVTFPMMIFQKEHQDVRLAFAAIWACAAYIAAAPWLLRQVVAFRRMEPAAPAPPSS